MHAVWRLFANCGRRVRVGYFVAIIDLKDNKMKLNYILIPIYTIAVAFAGQALSNSGLKKWYKTLKLPDFTPPGDEIGIIWTIIFILSATAAIVAWNSGVILQSDQVVLGLMFIVNGLMNVFWSFLFFYAHMLGYATIEAGALALSIVALIIYIYPISVLAAVLLVPYFLWVCFATFLTFRVCMLNK